MTTETDAQEGSWGHVVALYLGALVALIAVSELFLGLLPQQAALILVQFVGVLGAAVAYSVIMGDRRAPWPSLRRVGFSVGQLALMALAAIALGLAANAMMGLTVELIPAFEPMAEQYRERLNELVLKTEGLDRLLGIAAICVAAPICEEALFRGTLLQEQRRVSGTVAAVAGNGLLFSLFHVNPIGLIPLAIVGAFFAHLVVLTESLWPAIIGHAVFNGFNGVVLPELVPAVEEADVSAMELYGGEVVIGAVPQFLFAIALFGSVGVFFWWWMAQTTASEADG